VYPLPRPRNLSLSFSRSLTLAMDRPFAAREQERERERERIGTATAVTAFTQQMVVAGRCRVGFRSLRSTPKSSIEPQSRGERRGSPNPQTDSAWPLCSAPSDRKNGAARSAHRSGVGQAPAPSPQQERSISVSMTPGLTATAASPFGHVNGVEAVRGAVFGIQRLNTDVGSAAADDRVTDLDELRDQGAADPAGGSGEYDGLRHLASCPESYPGGFASQRNCCDCISVVCADTIRRTRT